MVSKKDEDSTRDDNVIALNMYRKQSHYSVRQRQKTEIVFSIYSSKIFPKLTVSLIWSQKLEDREKKCLQPD